METQDSAHRLGSINSQAQPNSSRRGVLWLVQEQSVRLLIEPLLKRNVAV